jgi:hypothetical protein
MSRVENKHIGHHYLVETTGRIPVSISGYRAIFGRMLRRVYRDDMDMAHGHGGIPHTPTAAYDPGNAKRSRYNGNTSMEY